MSIKTNIAELLNDDWINSLAEELQEIHKKYGEPEPAGGPTTEVRVGCPAHAGADNMGDWGGREEEAASAYNIAIDQIYSCIDYRHVGGGIWYTQWEEGSDQWRAYREEAEKAISDWLDYNEGSYTDDPYGILLADA